MNDTATKLLEVLDAALAREIPRPAPPEGEPLVSEPLVRVRLTRPVVIASYPGVHIQVGDILFLTKSETSLAIWENFGQQLEPFPGGSDGRSQYYS
jgi:hypothetical protein